jgi:hypothetical protein
VKADTSVSGFRSSALTRFWIVEDRVDEDPYRRVVKRVLLSGSAAKIIVAGKELEGYPDIKVVQHVGPEGPSTVYRYNKDKQEYEVQMQLHSKVKE